MSAPAHAVLMKIHSAYVSNMAAAMNLPQKDMLEACQNAAKTYHNDLHKAAVDSKPH